VLPLICAADFAHQWEQWLKAYTRKNMRRQKPNEHDDVRSTLETFKKRTNSFCISQVTQMEEMLRRKRGQVSAAQVLASTEVTATNDS